MEKFTITRKRMIKLQILAVLLIVLFGGSQLAAEQKVKKNTVAITDPKEGDAVGGRIVVAGTSTIHDKSHVWVLVHLKLLVDKWWPQDKPVVDENGNWQALAYIGGNEDIGFDFEIVAATFDKQAEAEILRYHDHGSRTGQWPPISFPRTTSNRAIVTVKKVK